MGLSGCKPGSALHGRYNNFRAYYNTYYNASRSLEEGEGALERSAVTVDRNRLVAVFPATNSTGQTGPFQDAIDKSADLLRERPTSKWADDALLVIGKAYFYQRNFAGADQKFRETMAAAEAIGDERLEDEARFWLGRTYAASNRFDEGVAVLEEGLADETGDQRWRSRMQLALGELYARAGRWADAVESLRDGAPDEDDADIAARAYVLLGQVEEHAENWDEAAAAYEEALRRNPAYELGYAARVGRALVLGLRAERPQEGLAIVRSMRSDDKNYDRRGELALIEAQLRAANGEDDRALALFRAVLYDEALAGAAVRGPAHYRLAEFYRDALGDYVRASAHFDTAATSLRAPAPDVRPARGAILDVATTATTYHALAETARQIAEADSLLELGDLSDEAFEARIEAIEAERLRLYVEEQRRLEDARTSQEFSEGARSLGQQNVGNAASVTQPTVGAEAGFLSFRSPTSIQAGLISFEQVWGDRPLVPNWRRRASIQAGDVATARGVIEGEVEGGFGINEGPPALDLSAVPRTPQKRSELITQLAGLRYQLANAFFLSLGRADTAAALYRTILDETPDRPVAVRARYALAEIERSRGREDAARPLYEAVAQADSAALGRASRARLGEEVEPLDVTNTSEDATPAYDGLRQRWRSGDPLGAAEGLLALGDAEPDAEVAPRAYLGAAAAYSEWVGTDSTALVRPLPDSLISPVLFAIADSLSQAEMAEAAQEYEAQQAAAVAAAAAADSLAAAAPPAPPDSPAAPDSLAVPDDEAPIGRPARIEELGNEQADEEITADARPSGRRRTLQADEGAPPDTAGATPPTSPAAPRGRTALPLVDSTSFTLRHHLRAVAARYPSTPYAERATALVAALPALPPFDPSELAEPDSAVAPADTSAVPIDSTTAPTDTDAVTVESVASPVSDSTAVRDMTRGEEALVPLDEPSPPARPELDEPESAPAPPGLRGDTPVNPAFGGFTWRVRTLSIPDEGESMVDVLRGAGFRASILSEAGGGAYIIALGQFGDEALAASASGALPAWARLRGEVVGLDGYEALAETGTTQDERP